MRTRSLGLRYKTHSTLALWREGAARAPATAPQTTSGELTVMLQLRQLLQHVQNVVSRSLMRPHVSPRISENDALVLRIERRAVLIRDGPISMLPPGTVIVCGLFVCH